ncbi:ABC transporter substrate-binding protein [Vibrio sp. SCSIO 43136]|uniref:ABC transporter substrate-binding protein n=1 Tax=Vibrio sp. SCSIO 43136 TaxID=2819101 RepID=UPI0020755F47|nr:ABC transporter substrate-binding protein [Vibrio sp. SCSIO 43136]USD66898.1 ABC transporter substrate-binding protein [Vibrio sp. SCSIO 43136]
MNNSNPNFLWCLAIALFCMPFMLSAKPYKIGIAQWTGYPDNLAGFKQGLEDAGLDLQQDVVFIEAQLGNDRDAYTLAANDLKEHKVDLVYSLTTPGTVIVKNVMPKTTPIVFSVVTYPADSGLIESFEYSGNNLVGTSNFIPIKHYISMLKAMVPEAHKVAIFHRKGEPNSKIQSANLIRQFRRNRIEAINIEATNLEDLRLKASDVASEVQAFVTTTDTLMQNGGEEVLIALSLEHSIPILSSNKSGIEKGATFGPVSDFYLLGKMSGELAAAILTQNVRPAQLESRVQASPVILVHRKNAEQIGVRIPQSLQDNIEWVE